MFSETGQWLTGIFQNHYGWNLIRMTGILA